MSVIAVIVVAFLASLMQGFMFMIGVGVVHHEWMPTIPTVGYWWSVIIVMLFRAALTIDYDQKRE